jgi:hypothetical protein
MCLVKNNPVPITAKDGRIVIELLIIGDIDSRAVLDEVARHRSSRIVHELPRDRSIFVNLIDCAASTLKNTRPGVNHGQRGNEKSDREGIIDDNGSDLNGLAEPHVVALKAAANCNIHGAIAIGNGSAINFLVKHPVDSLKLMREIGKVFPKGTNLGGHLGKSWINVESI